ncbi:DAZ-associated protein 2-like [Episyrphus balteatus]|uniref:DAZ-associated protein 2-like n=1 Tax=Episyrphus balteatus TaxID=286459 RepID=UPI0024851BDE|nr:DAZ-associated protein 2-like [Episyrphus balteatus]
MADNKNDNYPQLPSAPNGGQQQFQLDPSLYHRPPPPTYEESQRWNPQPMYAPQQGGGNFYPSMSGNPPPYAGIQQPSLQYAQQQQHHQHQHALSGFAPNHPQYAFNYTPQQQQQQMPAGAQMSPQQQISNRMASVNINQYPTVTFDGGARFTGQGAISIPPPPPGCAPTPEQLAALQGQPVILKKKKNSFF